MQSSGEKDEQDLVYDLVHNSSADMDATNSQLSKPAEAAIFIIPQEILDTICNYSTPRDIGALRATCTHLQEKIELVFKQTTFGTIEIHLDCRHLGYLKEVSSSRFAACVNVVHIRPRYKPLMNLSDTEWNEFETFRNDKTDVNWLVEALCALPNIARLEVEATTKPALQTSLAEDDVRNSRSIAAPGTGLGDRRPHKGISYAFQVALLAMDAMKKQGKGIPELRAGAMPDGMLRRSVDDMSLMPVRAGEFKGFAELSSLQLVCEVQEGTWGFFRQLHLANMLDHAPKLKKLKLSFWYMAGDWLTRSFEMVNLPLLSTLELEAAHVDVLGLEDFLKRHTPALRHLELKNIAFRNDVVVDVLTSILTLDELKLHSIKLQQLCNSKSGLLLFGRDVDTRVICHKCNQDRDATWRSEVGPGCDHATLAAQGEVEVKKELERVKKMCVLPWAPIA